jgi:hypothetical protein
VRQTLVPRIVTRRIVTNMQFLTTEEQIMQAASKLSSLSTGEAVLYVAGKGVAELKFPLPKAPFRMTPRFGKRKLLELRGLVRRRPAYATEAAIAAERRAFLDRLLLHLCRSSPRDRRATETRQERRNGPQGPSPLAI